jgi:hypothetical protein
VEFSGRITLANLNGAGAWTFDVALGDNLIIDNFVLWDRLATWSASRLDTWRSTALVSPRAT